MTVEDGDEVRARQTVAVILSPGIRTQLRAAQAQMLEANQPLAEAETLIAQRKSDRVFAKTKLERGQQLVEKAALTTQVFDQRVAKAETMGAAVRAAKAEHEQAQFDDQDRLGRGGRIGLILVDLKLVAPRGSRVQYKIF